MSGPLGCVWLVTGEPQRRSHSQPQQCPCVDHLSSLPTCRDAACITLFLQCLLRVYSILCTMPSSEDATPPTPTVFKAAADKFVQEQGKAT